MRTHGDISGNQLVGIDLVNRETGKRLGVTLVETEDTSVAFFEVPVRTVR
jgi:hypothetical protein